MKNPKQYIYTVFDTKWGWFGVLATEKGLTRTCLPQQDKEAVFARLLDGIDQAVSAKYRLIEVENAIKDYYRGLPVNFSDFKLDLDEMTDFQKRILTTLQTIKHGQTTTYGSLARLAGAQSAARAVGACMAKNPLPLVLGCHRVTAANGDLTGFSAPGGIQTKQRMLALERAAAR